MYSFHKLKHKYVFLDIRVVPEVLDMGSNFMEGSNGIGWLSLSDAMQIWFDLLRDLHTTLLGKKVASQIFSRNLHNFFFVISCRGQYSIYD